MDNVYNKNELTNAPSQSISYDGNGNLVTVQGATEFQHWDYVYDDENRLISWSKLSDKRTDFFYDGLGRLRQRLEYHYDDTGGSRPAGIEPESTVPPTDSWVLDSETRYIYDGKRVIQERDGSNTPLVSYTRGRDLSGSLEGAGGICGLLARSTGSSGSWATHNTYFADGNGNVTYMLNSSQAVVASYRYDPFGNIISKSGSLADANIYRFSSKEIHTPSGLCYYLYRFYDPNLQRWINRDPLGDQKPQTARSSGNRKKVELTQGANLYFPFRNDPVSERDPDGQFLPVVCVIIAGAIICGGCSKSPPPPLPPGPDCWGSTPTLGTGAVGKEEKLRDCESCCAGKYGGAYQGAVDPLKQCLDYCYIKTGSPVPGK